MDRIDKKIIMTSKVPSRNSEFAGDVIEKRLKVEKLKNPTKSEFELTQMIVQELKDQSIIK